MEEIPEYINLLSYLFIVVYMLSVPLETSIGSGCSARCDTGKPPRTKNSAKVPQDLSCPGPF